MVGVRKADHHHSGPVGSSKNMPRESDEIEREVGGRFEENGGTPKANKRREYCESYATFVRARTLRAGKEYSLT